MECNKDEAIRAKEIAEKKFESKDAVGALRFALKSQKLYPELDGVQQMIYSLNVHVAAADQVGGECDWYKILDVDPKADDVTIRGQYIKLALSLHPDNNKSVGAGEALKLVSRAWCLLSDKAKRAAYDEQRRNMKTSQEVPTPTGGGAPAPPGVNGIHDSNSDTISSSAGTDQTSGCSSASQDSPSGEPDTFWTYCSRCRSHHEYPRYLVDRLLKCPCSNTFIAKETGRPAGYVSSLRNGSHPSQTANQTNNAHGDLSSGGAPSAAANVSDQQGHTKVKRGREEGQASEKREEAIPRKSAAAKREGVVADGQEKVPGSTGNETGVLMDMDDCDAYAVKKSLGDGGVDVPSPDFHDFDKNRAEKSFAENQIWATYDDSDGMPRRYALIQSVGSSDPFKVLISWLIPRTSITTQHGLLDWATSKFPVTCGDFKAGGFRIINAINSFSHRVRWTKASNGDIRVFPRKGDVWALYRNWSPDWNELTPSEEIHKYDLVEVLEDYNEEAGVSVIPMIKVAGYRSMFHRALDLGEVRKIPGEEVSRFSHYIPSYLHRGQEAPGALKGCKELDPAATPEEHLRVVGDDGADV